jgi:hypothetical protein
MTKRKSSTQELRKECLEHCRRFPNWERLPYREQVKIFRALLEIAAE